MRGYIRFEKVFFRYHVESKNHILENLSFEIQPSGSMIEIVGLSGSGKTTIVKLKAALMKP